MKRVLLLSLFSLSLAGSDACVARYARADVSNLTNQQVIKLLQNCARSHRPVRTKVLKPWVYVAVSAAAAVVMTGASFYVLVRYTGER